MSTKYGSQADTRRLVEDDIALTDHAIDRYRQRTPHDCDVKPHTAWQRGEWIKHPGVAQSDGEDHPPDRVRIYCHGGASHEWGVAFLVTESEHNPATAAGAVDNVVVTVNHLQGFDHGPSRAYLHSHGPHGGDE